MIKLRLSAFTAEGSERDIEFIEKELASELLTRVLNEIDLYGEEERFQVLINGHRVDHEFLPAVQILKSDTVLIAPIISGGSFGQIFKTIAVIVAVVVVSAYTGGGGLGMTGLGWGATSVALASAGAAIATSLLLNSLIPPPNPGGLDFGVGGSGDFSSSQMYSISSQSNSVKKFGRVPKVYGQHRTFPNVAANPYTEIEADPNTGELVQYLYAVYDLGLGPNIVENIKIGDSLISAYSDVQYNLVDFHKPLVSEGVWDDLLSKNLIYYKGDSETDNSSTILDDNQEAGGALSGYQVVRTNAFNLDNSSQEIILTFLNPQGLIAYSTTGDSYERSIDVDIEFAVAGTGVYRRFNDEDFVESFRAVGGSSTNNDVYLSAFPFTPGAPYTNFSPPPAVSQTQEQREQAEKFGSYTYESWGIPAGTSSIILADGSVSLNRRIYVNGISIGKVISITSYSSGYSRYNLENPITNAIVVYPNVTTNLVYDVNTGLLIDTIRSPVGLNPNNVFYRKLEGRFTITRKETGQVYSTVKFTPKLRGQFDIRITRVRSYSAAAFNFQDKLALASIVTRFDRSPILTPNRHTFLEVKIRATNQLNGSIQNLSAVCTSVLDTWDGTQWIKKPTNNPAWVYVDLLIGQINKRAIDKSRLYLPSILEWAQFCDQIPTAPTGQFFVTPRFRCNFVLDFNTTLQSIINQVTNSSQASLNIIDGKYGVLIDKKRTTPVQVFTPRNSRDFSSTRNYTTKPHGVKVKFVDPAADWQLAEEVVYDDGYNALNATELDDLSSFGCTDPDQAWRFGRYMIAQNRLRQESISLTVDFEFLVCNRGDYVQITQDVMKVGGSPARVKTVVGTTITIDDSINTTANPYGYVYRSVSGISTSTLTVVNSNTFIVNGGIPSVGDLIVIGEMGQIVFNCLVKSITPGDDLSAQLILVEKADAIYDAESSDTIPDYSPQISVTVDTQNLPPAKVTDLAVLENSYLCGANSFEHYIKIDWDVPVGTAFEYFEIFVDNGRGFDVVSTTRDSEYTYFVEDSRLGFLHSFKVVAVSSNGKKLEINSVDTVTATPVRKTTRPMNVSSLSTNITGEVLQLDWEPVNDCIREYLIRYTPNLNGTWEASIPLLRVDKNTTLASTQARTGTYLIKAVDFNENESQRATVAITTIPELFNLNVVSTITDFPTLVGSKDRVVKNGDTLLLKNKEVGGVLTNEYFSEGYYYYNGFLDLGEIYTVRLQSLIQAEGYTLEDIMANWITLNDVVAMSNSRFSEWDVQTEYRVTDAFNVMADWTNLSIIDPISEGVQDNWSDWRRFTIGDGTGRIFQFRLKLISNKPSVTPRVFDGTIKADMPDRLISFENLIAPDTGYELIYDQAFKGPTPSPSVQITIENGQSGDYWEFIYKSLDGFEIIFYDNNNVAVSRIFDAQIKGFGRKSAFVI